MRQTLSKTFANPLNMQKQFEKMLGKRVTMRGHAHGVGVQSRYKICNAKKHGGV